MNNVKTTGGLAASLRKSKEGPGSLGKLKIVRSSKQSNDYTFPKPSSVPAGQYRSRIADILESTTAHGDPAVDVHYDLRNGVQLYRVKMRYPLDSTHFGVLCDALLDAGVPENANIKKGVGVEETIKLDYPHGSGIGTIVSRVPLTPTSSIATDDEDEDDDMLDDDDLLDD